MARTKRQVSPTGIYHVLLRGIEDLFEEKADYKEFIKIIDNHFAQSNAKLLGYALIKNRVHILIDEGNSNVSAEIKPICTRYARYYNRVHNLQGKLFYDRYKSEPILDDDSLLKEKSFLKSIPSDYTFGTEGVKKADTLASIDDYHRMTDEELKAYIEAVFKCDIDTMPDDKKRVLAEKIISGKRISAGRVYLIFDLKRRTQAKSVVKTEKPKAKEPEKKQETNKNSNNLSVWLL